MAGWVYFDQIGIPRSSIEGVDRVISNINKEFSHLHDMNLRGLIKAAALIHYETVKGDVRVPVDYGNLKASWFVTTSKGKLQAGGGKTHTPEGAGGSFKGPAAGMLGAGHAAILTEMKAKAEALSKVYKGPFLIMGYSANYALWVHEMLDPGIKWKAEKSGPKWFEAALKKHKNNLIKVVAGGGRIKNYKV